jgi:predicted NUDIX family NTP pyrophosphohydrolase
MTEPGALNGALRVADWPLRKLLYICSAKQYITTDYMKHIFALLTMIVSMTIMTSCNDNDTDLDMWAYSNTNAENVTYRYDATAAPQHTITANYKGGIIVMAVNYNDVKVDVADIEDATAAVDWVTVGVQGQHVAISFPETSESRNTARANLTISHGSKSIVIRLVRTFAQNGLNTDRDV